MRTFIKLILKYRSVATNDGVAEELVHLSKSIKRVVSALKDSQISEMIAVAIPTQMSLAETQDLSASLNSMSIPLGRLVINNVVPAQAAARCGFCGERRAEQLGYVHEFQKSFQNPSLVLSPQMTSEVHGAQKLREFWAQLYRVVDRSRARGKGEA